MLPLVVCKTLVPPLTRRRVCAGIRNNTPSEIPLAGNLVPSELRHLRICTYIYTYLCMYWCNLHPLSSRDTPRPASFSAPRPRCATFKRVGCKYKSNSWQSSETSRLRVICTLHDLRCSLLSMRVWFNVRKSCTALVTRVYRIHGQKWMSILWKK